MLHDLRDTISSCQLLLVVILSPITDITIRDKIGFDLMMLVGYDLGPMMQPSRRSKCDG